MVANLTAQKKDWARFSEWAEKASAYKKELVTLVDADTKAFEAIMQARALPKTTEPEKAYRVKALQDATFRAIRSAVPGDAGCFAIHGRSPRNGQGWKSEFKIRCRGGSSLRP